MYHNYEEVVQLILEVFNTVASQQICYLSNVSVLLIFIGHCDMNILFTKTKYVKYTKLLVTLS